MFSPSNYLETLLKGLNADIVSDVIIGLLIIIFLYSYYKKRNHQYQIFTGYTPTLLTSLGILGTFAGIVIGLLGFDTNDIDNSIGPLLEGLKTAFMTSLTGMLLAIIYKTGTSKGFLIKEQEEKTTDDDIGSLDFYQVMEKQVESIEQLKKAIAGDDESSLIGVMKLHKSDASDHYRATKSHLDVVAESFKDLNKGLNEQRETFDQFQEKLWKQMQDFAEMLSKSATEQVIEALKQVIQDFNNNLIEQFGDNFKALNEAVLKLVEWQENYKHQLEDMSHKYAQGVEAITQTETSVAHISEEAQVIPQVMGELKTVMETNQHQISELDRHLEAFKDIRDKAVEAIPEIDEQIDRVIKGAEKTSQTLAEGMQESANKMNQILAEGSEQFRDNVAQTNAALTEAAQTTTNTSQDIKDQLSGAVTDINNGMRNLLDELQKGGEQLQQSFSDAGTDMLQAVAEWRGEFTSTLETVGNELNSTIERNANENRESAERIFRGLEKTIENALSETGESVEKHVRMMDDAMGQEIEKVMQAMGNSLAQISNQFTNDYRKLVDQMNKVVQQR